MADNKDKKNMTLRETLDGITFKNRDISKIRALQAENAKLKDQIGRRKSGSREISSAKIQGLQSLRPDLGNQFVSGSRMRKV
jgi:hypothetical protein